MEHHSTTHSSTWDERQYLDEQQQHEYYEQQDQEPQIDKQQLLREVLRKTHAAEVCGSPEVRWSLITMCQAGGHVKLSLNTTLGANTH